MSTLINDTLQREQALDTTQSFLVQAPAGSGKTELLTQRYLALLTTVMAPEEIIAITFTRKAAAEMRDRILSALQKALTQEDNLSPHAQKTDTLAKNVLAYDKKLGWDLLNSPNRLRIQTIDSLCSSLTAQMPILSHFGKQPQVKEDASAIYRLAAREILKALENDYEWSPAVGTLLLHLHNDFNKAERLLVSMLSQRDQWLSHIINCNPRVVLENALSNIIDEHLEKLHHHILENEPEALLELLQFAGTHAEPYHNLSNLDCLPECKHSQLLNWKSIASLLLTKNRLPRKKLTINEGFPAASSTANDKEQFLYQNMKERMLAWLNRLEPDSILLNLHSETLDLPPASYDDKQWEIIDALVTLLPILTAQLNLLFQEEGMVDYIEIALQAVNALGSTQMPTDLALSLDYQISHLLVDEFQDTSITQFRLLELLTAGWQVNDGRTLFLVGDPMQSIYRFRKAEVGLFLQTKLHGINQLPLTFLQLNSNFRSNKSLVDWFNDTFKKIFPNESDLTTGSITYSASTGIVESKIPNKTQHLHALVNAGEEDEAEHIASIIKKEWGINPNAKIAILVQARSHLYSIIPSLKNHNIPYHAVDIEFLTNRMVIQDLLNLTKAFLHLNDRTAWLALLRAPWCGLTLTDLYLIADKSIDNTIFHTIEHLALLDLSDDGKKRLERILPILKQSIQQRYRLPFAEFIESTWLALSGPACLNNKADLEDANLFFNLLHELAHAEEISDITELEEQLSSLAAKMIVPEEPFIEIMTVHKSKGLEYDVVILPGLSRAIRSDSHQLLLWQERPTLAGKNELILAPIKKVSADPIYDYLRLYENKKAQQESIRLLYVAATRAKSTLYLIGSITNINDELSEPSKNSLLGLLWPSTSSQFTYIPTESIVHQNSLEALSVGLLKRIKTDKTLYHYDDDQPEPVENKVTLSPIKKLETPQIIGLVIHRMLYHFSQMPSLPNSIDIYKNNINQLCMHYGLTSDETSSITPIIMQSLSNTLTDRKGSWILNNQHKDAASELSLNTIKNSKLTQIIVDRTFICDNTRWIIDYKTSQPNNINLDTFLKQEKEKYRDQLEQYANAFTTIEKNTIRLGLYFPFVPAWVEWEYE
ncbi:MAG: UvrD-helicase domain-containing protein [Gammaproteobacteria bacterium]